MSLDNIYLFIYIIQRGTSLNYKMFIQKTKEKKVTVCL